MLRPILSALLALVAGALGISLVQGLNFLLFPPPPGLDFNDPVQLEAIMAQMHLGAMLMVELSYALGCLLAGAVVGRLAGPRRMAVAGVVGLLFTLAGFANMASVPTPLWLAVLTTVTYMPACLGGAWLARPRG